MTEDIDSNILRRFDLQNKLGKGAYGVVWQVVQKDQRVERDIERLALKKCFNCFHNGDVDAQRTASCTNFCGLMLLFTYQFIFLIFLLHFSIEK